MKGDINGFWVEQSVDIHLKPELAGIIIFDRSIIKQACLNL